MISPRSCQDLTKVSNLGEVWIQLDFSSKPPVSLTENHLSQSHYFMYIVMESHPITATAYSPWGEKTRRLIGRDEIPLLLPVSLSVSATISFLTSSKSVNFLPLQWRNSANSVQYAKSKVKELMHNKMYQGIKKWAVLQ